MRDTHAIWNIKIKCLNTAPVSFSRSCTLDSRFCDSERDAPVAFMNGSRTLN
jgi:hypothetical protein